MSPSSSRASRSFPWLTVLENVEAPLIARGVGAIERHKRALKMIDTVGLDGFETAYPKELSGGMKQRVGFARALVVEPEVLFMDEPFSALDVLTAENLRSELLELWLNKKMPTTAIFIVTHNIEEAVLLADRVIVLGRNPGRIRSDFEIDIPQYRDRKSPRFLAYVDYIYKTLTHPDEEASVPGKAAAASRRGQPREAHQVPDAAARASGRNRRFPGVADRSRRTRGSLQAGRRAVDGRRRSSSHRGCLGHAGLCGAAGRRCRDHARKAARLPRPTSRRKRHLPRGCA